MPDNLQIKLCDIQGRLFELSIQKKLNSREFIEFFMQSATAKALDSRYHRFQWAGEEYLLEEIIEEADGKLPSGGEIFSKDCLYGISFLYRYWHYYMGESSAEIAPQVPVSTMKRNYGSFHCMAPELAIEDLKEISEQNEKNT